MNIFDENEDLRCMREELDNLQEEVKELQELIRKAAMQAYINSGEYEP